jgi:hypothetical protein
VKRLTRERGRLVAGVTLLVAAVVVLGIGYASVADEIFVAVQLPYVLGGGVGALLCAGTGLVLLRSQEDAMTRTRLKELEIAHDEMSDRFDALGERVEYVTQLLEAALLEDATGDTRHEVRLG